MVFLSITERPYIPPVLMNWEVKVQQWLVVEIGERQRGNNSPFSKQA